MGCLHCHTGLTDEEVDDFFVGFFVKKGLRRYAIGYIPCVNVHLCPRKEI